MNPYSKMFKNCGVGLERNFPNPEEVSVYRTHCWIKVFSIIILILVCTLFLFADCVRDVHAEESWDTGYLKAPASTVYPDRYAILDKIAFCESGNDYQKPSNISSAYGKYQITWATWNEIAKLTGRTDKTNPEDQEINARKLYDLRGLKPWVASKNCWGN